MFEERMGPGISWLQIMFGLSLDLSAYFSMYKQMLSFEAGDIQFGMLNPDPVQNIDF